MKKETNYKIVLWTGFGGWHQHYWTTDNEWRYKDDSDFTEPGKFLFESQEQAMRKAQELEEELKYGYCPWDGYFIIETEIDWDPERKEYEMAFCLYRGVGESVWRAGEIATLNNTFVK